MNTYSAPACATLAIMLPIPRPLEILDQPHLDGRTGRNRAPGEGMLRADSDLQAVQAWLAEVRDSPQTLRAYRKEIERLLLWCWLERGRALSDLGREDLQAFEDFLADPQPRERWCGPTAPRHTERWRPLRGPLGPGSRRTALVILHGLFGYLVETGYLARNPLRLPRRRRAVVASPVGPERFLEEAEWRALRQTVAMLPQQSRRQQVHYQRCRLLLHVLYLLGARVGEVAASRMGDFVPRRGRWWWEVTGKGGKAARVPVNAEMLAALKAYRRFLGWPEEPLPGEERPLIVALDTSRGVSANMLYRIMRSLFHATAVRLDDSDPRAAARLRRASIHWLRHTSISAQLRAGLDIATVQRNARHSRLETTGGYLHEETARWHAAMERHRLDDSPDEETSQ